MVLLGYAPRGLGVAGIPQDVQEEQWGGATSMQWLRLQILLKDVWGTTGHAFWWLLGIPGRSEGSGLGPGCLSVLDGPRVLDTRLEEELCIAEVYSGDVGVWGSGLSKPAQARV